MSGALKSLKQLAEFAHPRTVKHMRAAGALTPKSPLALARTLPWLVGRGASLGILCQANAMTIPHKPALHDRNGTLTFKELDTRANRVAHMLEAEGVSGGDKIALLLRNGREMIEVALGAQKVGVIVCPLNTWAKTKELEATLGQADPKLLLYDTAHTEQVEKVVGNDLTLLAVGDPEKATDDSGDYEDLLMRQSTSAPFPFTRNRGAPRVIIHTSGTTGTPKGAARNSSDAGAGELANLLSVVPYHRDDVVVCPAPLFHSFGLATFTFATTLGMTLVLPEKFDPEGSLQLIEKHSASAASFVPVMIKRILDLDEDVRSRYDLSSLRIVMASGSAMSPDLRKAAMGLFGDVLYDLYGSTEIGWVTIATPDDMKHNPKTVGKPVPGTEVAIFSKESGDKLPPGEVGELFIKSNMLFEGYTSGESKDERDGYTSIGDLGRMDDDGYLFVEGRADDMVVIGGENVYPIEVEELIDGMDGVNESAVLGVTDEEYGEVLAAFVVGSASEDQILKRCKSDLASYKVPKRVEKLDELPRTSTGKILKRKLIEQLEGAEPLDES